MSVPPGTVIVNADDFGMSSVINRAIVACFDQRLISSTTIMANMPGFEEACTLAAKHQLTDRIGVHLNLTEGTPLLSELRSNPALCDPAGNFRRFRSRVLSRTDRSQIASEITAQIQRCHNAGLRLTHADSHQHVHNEPMVFLAIQSALKQQGIRHLRISRNMDSMPRTSVKQFSKSCFNQMIAFHGLRGTDYFGAVSNFEQFRNANLLGRASFEILTHPSFDEQGVLIDHVENYPLAGRLATAFHGIAISAYPPSREFNAASAFALQPPCVSRGA
ncbi:MAG TPA: ChbG/HpnK family deacetylase [Planctomycetaceae bacterium]|nr:ChbG/HpnK family deacetylase [Planctomycetaceae bacterium]HQZ69024.1 ChbG/HpnK family deacetylase [Planctomycetaceae bacterium]